MKNLMDFAKSKPMVLIVEDEIDLAEMVSKRLTRAGFDYCIADTITEGVELCTKYKPDIIILDVNLPDGSSIKSIDKFLDVGEAQPPSIILTTSESNAKVAELFNLIRDGKISSYIQKIYSMDALANQVLSEAEKRKNEPKQLVAKVITKAIDQKRSESKSSFIAHSPAMLKVKKNISSLANVFSASQADGVSGIAPVIFISGETGSGKSALAEYFQSLFPDTKYMPLDTTQLTSELIAVELFGATKGSYTGADTKKDRIGILEDIGDGILFFDEIGDMNQDLQSKLLMPIQHRTFRPIGATQTKDFRGIIVCATNRNLEKMVEEGTFRSDLYHRIKTHEFVLPPLRERVEDIPDIARNYLDKNLSLYKLPELNLDDSAIEYLSNYSWPGNIRELQNVLHKVMMLYVTGEIEQSVTTISSDTISQVLKYETLYVNENEAVVEPKTDPLVIPETLTKPNKEQVKRYKRIMAFLNTNPGASVRQISIKLKIPYATVHHTLKFFNPTDQQK